MKARLLFLLLLATTSLFAAGLDKYKDWGNSPQGYFMTTAERAQWATIKSDAEAEKFVNDFLAKRGPNFVAEVQKAADAADKYLTAGKTKGSRTLRGKTVILLGPPSAIAIEQRTLTTDRRMTASQALGVSSDGGGGGRGGGGGGQGPSASSVAEVANSAGNAGAGGAIPVYKLTYAADKLGKMHPAEFIVRVDIEPNGTDKIRDPKMQSELDAMFEAVANARLAAAQTTPSK